MKLEIRELDKGEFPSLLKEISDPPKKLFLAGTLPPQENKILCIVGSRKHTEYGREVCEYLIKGLAGFPVSIVSGLALGMDSIAHRSALAHNIHTLAVPGSGLGEKHLYPQSHRGLAEEIVSSGGGLMSEFENEASAAPWTFPQRNRIMAGMSHAVMVIEAEEKSGTLITSKLATEYNRDVLTVPGSIFSKQSDGPHMLIRLGATPIRKPEDLLNALGFDQLELRPKKYSPENKEEELILKILETPKSRDDIIRESELPAFAVNGTLAVLEIKGVIVESMGEIRLV